ncbi:MAG: von Willebrand factor type A domain-containing protein, partial [Sulfuricaulis sp.]|nr:von Willebrand factor type A domain-containing protein [Sulfuricaulis sp.]
MNCFINLTRGAVLVLILAGLTACTSDGMTVRQTPEHEIKSDTVTTGPLPQKTEETQVRDGLASHKEGKHGRHMEQHAMNATVPAAVGTMVVPPEWRYPSEPVDRENYAHFNDNPVKRAAEVPVSTFSIDVDTGAYA